MYYLTKVRVESGKGKFINESYIVECSVMEEVFGILAKSLTNYTITGITETKYLDDFIASTCGYYWDATLEVDTPDGKSFKEQYLVEGKNMNEVRDKIIIEVDNCSIEQFKKHSEVKILEILR